MNVPYIILSSWLSVCQKLSNLVEIWWSSDKNKLGHFLAHPVEVSSILVDLDRLESGRKSCMSKHLMTFKMMYV